MRIIGCDLHARQQTLAMLDTETGEIVNLTLEHEDNCVREFYSKLPWPVLVGIEATGFPVRPSGSETKASIPTLQIHDMVRLTRAVLPSRREDRSRTIGDTWLPYRSSIRLVHSHGCLRRSPLANRSRYRKETM